MPQNKRPILVLPTSRTTSRASLPQGFGGMMYPSGGRQSQRLGIKFTALQDIFNAQSMELSTSLNPVEPEKVLVLETVGSVDDLMKAVLKVEGLEWLVEGEGDEVDPDEDFHGQIPRRGHNFKQNYIL